VICPTLWTSKRVSSLGNSLLDLNTDDIQFEENPRVPEYKEIASSSDSLFRTRRTNSETVISDIVNRVSNWERVNNAQYDVIGGSIVSTITMNDRWTQFSKILGSNPNITGTKFSEILSGLVETYNDGVFVTRKFQDNRDFFQYLTPRYTNDQIATVRSNPSINITNSSYPIVYAYPTDMGLIGYDTGMIQSVRDAIGYMKATGEPVFVKFPKGAINFDTETIIYGTPISIDDQEDSFAAIRLSVVGSLVREMNLDIFIVG